MRNDVFLLCILILVVSFFGILKNRKRFFFFSIVGVIGVLLILNWGEFYKYEDEHQYIINNEVYSIPLPGSTKFCFRTSDTSAVYKTRCSFEKIKSLYSNLSSDNILSFSEFDKRVIRFKYNDDLVTVTVVEKPQKYNDLTLQITQDNNSSVPKQTN